MKQIEPFKPGFTLGERVESIEKKKDGNFYVVTNCGTEHMSKVIVIAAGLGCFEPRKPIIENLSLFEDKGVDYIIKDPNKYKNNILAGLGNPKESIEGTYCIILPLYFVET